MKKQRAELLLHTKFSDDISMIGVKEILRNAEAYGLSAIAFTNLNNVQDFAEISYYAECAKVKIIYGAEVICKSDAKPEGQRITLLVRNQQGVKELYKIISSINRTDCGNFVDISVLLENREHLLVGIRELDSVIPCDYLELHPAYDDTTMEANRTLYMYGREQSVPVVAVNNAHYFSKEDGVCRNIVCASRELEEEEQPKMYLRTTEEMLEEYSYLGEEEAEDVVVRNTLIISDMVETVDPIKRETYDYQVLNVYEEMERIAVDKAYEIYGNPLPDVIGKRLQTELALIKKCNNASYYLIAAELVNRIAKRGYSVGSRGLLGSVLVNFLLGISNINPLPPHYYCLQCHYFEEQTLIANGLDLPSKQLVLCQDLVQIKMRSSAC